MSDDVTAIEIRLSRVITDDGKMEVRVSTPDNFSAVEALGLLDVARFKIYNDLGKDVWK